MTPIEAQSGVIVRPPPRPVRRPRRPEDAAPSTSCSARSSPAPSRSASTAPSSAARALAPAAVPPLRPDCPAPAAERRPGRAASAAGPASPIWIPRPGWLRFWLSAARTDSFSVVVRGAWPSRREPRGKRLSVRSSPAAPSSAAVRSGLAGRGSQGAARHRASRRDRALASRTGRGRRRWRRGRRHRGCGARGGPGTALSPGRAPGRGCSGCGPSRG